MIVEKHAAADKVLPNDSAIEANVLGACLASTEALTECVAITRPDHFLADPHRLVADAIWALDARGEPVGPTTVAAWMRSRDTLDRVGGQAFVEQLSDGARDFEHVFRHAEIVREWARARCLIVTAQRIVAEGRARPPELVKWIESAAARIELASTGDGGAMAGQDAGEVLDALEADWTSPTGEIVIGTGIPDLDALLGGLRPGGLYVIGAWSSLGKTALAACIADHVAVNERIGDRRCGAMLVTIEMPNKSFMKRMWCARAMVNNRRFTKRLWPFISAEEHARLALAKRTLREAPLRVYDRSDVTISWIRSEARRLKSRFEIEGRMLAVLLCDYAQLVSPERESARRGNREQEVAAIARAMKNLAKELGIAVILPAQLNEAGRDAGRPPAAHDLRESRELHHAADAVILIDNPGYNPATSRDPSNLEVGPAEPVNLIVDKARGEGVTGTARAAYLPGCTRFVGWDEDSMGLHLVARVGKKEAVVGARRDR